MTRLLPALSLLSALLLCAPAHAVQGDGPLRHAPGTRAHAVTHAWAQAQLDEQPAWRSFRDAHGDSWTATWDEATGTPVRFWGPGWDVDGATLTDDTAAWEIGWEILRDAAPLLGDVELDDLAPRSLDRRAGITTLTFERTWHDLPVEGARISLRFKAGRFVMGGFSPMPGIRVSPSPTVTPGLAEHEALVALGWQIEQSSLVGLPRLVVLPLLGERFGQADYRLAWRVEVRATSHPSHRLVWIDASDGSFLAWEERIRFITGTVQGSIDDRYPENGLTTAPLPGVSLDAGDAAATADATGGFTVTADLPATVEFEVGSGHFEINSHSAGGNTTFFDTMETDGDVVTGAPTASSDLAASQQRAELDIHVAAHVVRARALTINPSFPWAAFEAVVHVNRDDAECNAWFEAAEEVSINFVRQGGGCNNTGRVADVAYHEYGHGFHGYSIIPGTGAFDASLSEGLADYMAVTINGEPAMARGFFVGSSDPLRDLGPDRVWPDDVSSDPHQTGLIMGGALWDLREQLILDLGEVDGIAHADYIMWQIASRAEDIPTSYAEALLADDDNGNLTDGTPNQCTIDEAFGAHGLGPGAGVPLFYIDHEPLDGELEPGVEVRIELASALSNPDCATGQLDEVLVRWSYDSDDVYDFDTIELDHLGGADYGGDLPGGPDGRLLRYRIELYDEGGDLVGELPVGSRTDPWLGAWVGDREELFFADFESDDGDFTHELLDGPQQEGADDWGWGSAGGMSGDPAGAFSGGRIWGNDITPADNWNGAYQPGVHNVLFSPVIDVGDASPVLLQFRRWLTVEDGFYDKVHVYVNGEEVWTQYASPSQTGADKHHEDTHWAFRSYDITGLVDDDGAVQVSWDLVSDGGLEMGGWNIDDVGIYASIEIEGDDDDTGPDDDDDDGPGGSAGFTASGSSCSCTTSDRIGGGLAWLLLPLTLLGLRRRR